MWLIQWGSYATGIRAIIGLYKGVSSDRRPAIIQTNPISLYKMILKRTFVKQQGPLLLTTLFNCVYNIDMLLYHGFLCDIIIHPCPNYNGSLYIPPSMLKYGCVITSHFDYPTFRFKKSLLTLASANWPPSCLICGWVDSSRPSDA